MTFLSLFHTLLLLILIPYLSLCLIVEIKRKIVPKLLQVYTRCSKIVAPTLLPADPVFTVDPNPPHFNSLPPDPPLPTGKMEYSTTMHHISLKT